MPRFTEWVQHHTTSLAATAVDFATMVAVVEWAGLSPVVATVVAATAGALTNFMLGRYWTYRRRQGATAVSHQMARYAAVAVVSLALNAIGEHVFANLLNVQYLLGRVITAVVVSNAWNYPMQRFFVFAERKKAPA